MKIYANPPENPNKDTVKSENPNAFSDALTNPTEKEKLKDLHGKKKLQYIWDYYKAPIIIFIIILVAVIYTVYAQVHSKDTLVTVTCVNVGIENDLEESLTTNFLSEYLDLSSSKYQVILDKNLMVGNDSDAVDPQYAYSSQMKLVAFVSSGQLDVVLMNQTGFDYLSQSGFLEDLTELFADADPELNDLLKDRITENIMIVSDNSAETAADPSLEYTAETETLPFGIKLNGSKFFPEGYFNQDIYAGIAVNTERKEAAIQYIRYLFDLEPGDLAVIPEK